MLIEANVPTCLQCMRFAGIKKDVNIKYITGLYVFGTGIRLKN